MCTSARVCNATHPQSIKEIIVRSYERVNDTTYYPIRVITYTNESMDLRYTFSDFIQFSRTLHKRYDVEDYQLHVLKKQHSLLKRGSRKYFERQLELEDFCQRLLLLPEAIRTSNFFLSFFWPSTHQQQQREQQQHQQEHLRSASVKRMFSIKSNHSTLSSSTSTSHPRSPRQQNQMHLEGISPLTTTMSSTNMLSQQTRLTRLHSQNDVPSKESALSVPAMCNLRMRHSFSHVVDNPYTETSSSGSSCSSSGMSRRTSMSRTQSQQPVPLSNAISNSSSSSGSGSASKHIKIKVIYDTRNIIIIRVPRLISFTELRSQIIQKFALLNIALPNTVSFRAEVAGTSLNTKRSSCASTNTTSTTSSVDSQPQNHTVGSTTHIVGENRATTSPSTFSDTAMAAANAADDVGILISAQADLIAAMEQKWYQTRKIVLRCIV